MKIFNGNGCHDVTFTITAHYSDASTTPVSCSTAAPVTIIVPAATVTTPVIHTALPPSASGGYTFDHFEIDFSICGNTPTKIVSDPTPSAPGLCTSGLPPGGVNGPACLPCGDANGGNSGWNTDIKGDTFWIITIN